MNASQLKPAGSLSQRFGVKSIIYGGPGSGKTPMMNTAPRPVLLVTEPGLLSMRGSKIPAWEGYTVPTINEFMKWFMDSAEAKQFDTLCIDSLSNISELVLAQCLAATSHGKKAYGDMSEKVMKIVNDLYYMPQKHVVMICKQGFQENGKQTVTVDGKYVTEPIIQKCPFFPGKDLNAKIPHLFDNILHMSEAAVPGQPKPIRALRTVETPEIKARHRVGYWNELELAEPGQPFPNLANIFARAMH